MNGSACSRLGELLALRDDDRLSPSEERLLHEHLATCPACAAEALRHDPVLLFARDAAPELLPAEARERFVEDVLAATAAAKADRRLRVSHGRTGLRIAASLFLAASLVGVWFVRGRGARPTTDAPSPVVAAREARPAPAEPVPAVEEAGSGGAVVYQFPATKPGEPTVVFLVDRNADI